MFKYRYIFLLLSLSGIFFHQYFLYGKIPIPADTIVGMYHPWRDFYAKEYPNGIPFKNPLITDPVRQQYVWRKQSMENIRQGSLPLWNPYSFSGYPLLANIQSAVFYPANILYFLVSFNTAWSVQVILQTVFSGIFMYLYLKNLTLRGLASFLGAFIFSFSGFMIAWLEWNTIGHTAAWLPLILLAIDKLRYYLRMLTSGKQAARVSKRAMLFWFTVLTFSYSFSFFAGHLQTFFYLFIVSLFYAAVRIVKTGSSSGLKLSVIYLLSVLSFILITSAQWYPAFNFINRSARASDLTKIFEQGWFIPWQHLSGYLIPDFFGNPATNNYWGVWNYGEFAGYVGILPLILALYALWYRKDMKVLFFGSILFLSMLFSFDTYISRLPFILNIPFLSTAQPTRLIFLTVFSLSVLTALGFDRYISAVSAGNIRRIVVFVISVITILAFITVRPSFFGITTEPSLLAVAKRNTVFPVLLCVLSAILLLLPIRKKYPVIFSVCAVILAAVDLFRFGWKFTPFTPAGYLYPDTVITRFLREDNSFWRLMSLDRRIMPPNFSVAYGFRDTGGYDPLYLSSYAKLAASWNEGKPSSGNTSFNRIITPADYGSFIADLLGVKYILSYGQISSGKTEYVMNEGNTYLYRNKNSFPHFYFPENTVYAPDDNQALAMLFDLKEKTKNTAIITGLPDGSIVSGTGNGELSEISSRDGSIRLEVRTEKQSVLVVSEVYYPSWHVYIDGRETPILKANYLFMGAAVPQGKHRVEFRTELL